MRRGNGCGGRFLELASRFLRVTRALSKSEWRKAIRLHSALGPFHCLEMPTLEKPHVSLRVVSKAVGT